jgi:ATP-dependent protease Clp ATPase subunit
MENTMLQIMFDIPSNKKIERVTITKECIVNDASPLISNRPKPQIDPDAMSAS